MLVYLAEYLTQFYTGFNVFSYLTFRAILGLLTALSFALWWGPKLIERLQLLQIGQVVRNDGPESHFSKRGTPTMGGLLVLAGIFISVLLWGDLGNRYVWVMLFVLGSFGLIGFLDDYRKVVRKDPKGWWPVGSTFYSRLQRLLWPFISTPPRPCRVKPN